MKKVCRVFLVFLLLIPTFCFSASLSSSASYENGWKNISAGHYDSALKDFDESANTLPDNDKWLAQDGKAWVAYYQGNYAEAKKQFLLITEKYPHAYLSHKGLGYIDLKENAWEKAYYNLSTSFEQAPLQPLNDYLYAVKSFLAGKQYFYAEKLLYRAQTNYPQSGDVQFYLAKILWVQGKKAEAYPLLLTASYYSPATVSPLLDSLTGLDIKNIKPALMNMGWGLYVDGFYAAALYRFNQYLKLEPSDVNALRGKGFCLVRLGQFEAAKKILTEVLHNTKNNELTPVVSYFYAQNKQSVPVYTDTAVMLGWAEYNLSHYKRAETLFSQALSKQPNWINARLGLAYVLKAAGNKNYPQEVELIDSQAPGYVVMPEIAPHQIQQGQLLYSQAWADLFAKKYDQARSKFVADKKLLPKDQQWLAQDGIAWIAFYQEQYASAADQFRTIIAKNKAAYLSYKGLSYVQLKENQYDKAYKNLQQSITLSPTQGAAVYEYAVKAFMDGNQPQYANALITKGLHDYPNSGELLFYKAKQLWATRHREQVYPLLLKATYFAPVLVNAQLDTLPGLDVSKIKVGLLNLGWGLYANLQYQAALNRFDQYYALIPHKTPLSLDDLNALRGQGYCYYSLQYYIRARKKLERVVNNPLESQLQPITSYFYTTDKKYAPIQTNSQVILGWAEYYLNNYSEAKKNFTAVLQKNHTWVNPRLGLATVLHSTGQKDESATELKNINYLVPGYGQIFVPAKPFPLTFILKSTYSKFGNNSVKRRAATYNGSFSYAPSSRIQLGGGYTYQHILFKQIAITSPSANNRLDYFLNLYSKPINAINGYLGIATKGNYFIKSAYNDKGIDHRLIPYVGVMYKSASQLNNVETGYSRQSLNDSIKTVVDQYSASFDTLELKSWMFGVTLYSINLGSNSAPTANYFSVQPAITYFINSKQDIAVEALIGRRKQAYDLMLNKVYDVRDREIGGGGVTYTYHIRKHCSIFVDTSAERFVLDSNTTKRYWAYYLTAGMII